jgi:hypothetical protein
MFKYQRTIVGAFALALGLALIFTWAAGPGARAQDESPAARQAPLEPKAPLEPAAPLGTAFTYQGQLADDGEPAAGPCDFRFSLFDAPSDGAQVGSTLTQTDVALNDGRFTSALDFGVGVFGGDARWLEISVRCPAGDGVYTILNPRQELTAAPYALYADLLDGEHASAFADASHDHWGETWSGSGTGLSLSGGEVGLSGSGSGTGVYGENPSTSGEGVYGVASANSGITFGVRGDADSTSGVGVRGAAFATGGNAQGVQGVSFSDEGRGVYGAALASSGTTYGVAGLSISPDGAGVFGEASADSGIGVYGYSSASSGNGYGVFAVSDGGTGGYFRGSDNLQPDVVLGGGDGTGDDGTLSSDPNFVDSDVFIRSNDEVWIYLDDNNNTTSEFRIYNGDGAVVHKITETGLKSAVLQTDSYGQRAVYTIESPEVWLEDFGSASLVDGKVGVAFDPMFAETVNRDLDYHVFLTPVCQEPVLLFVTEKTAAGFAVGGVTLDGQPAGCDFDYRVTAKRLGVEDIRLEEVTDDEQGQR